MKKFAALTVGLAMMLSFASCGDIEKSSKHDSDRIKSEDNSKDDENAADLSESKKETSSSIYEITSDSDGSTVLKLTGELPENKPAYKCIKILEDKESSTKFEYETYFDQYDNLIKSDNDEYYYDYSNDGKIINEYLMRDSELQHIKSYEYNPNGSVKHGVYTDNITGTSEYFYDEHGNLLYTKGLEKMMSSTHEYEYDENGNAVIERIYVPDSEDLYSTTYIKYDQNNNLTEKKIVPVEKYSYTGTKITRYQYDDYGNIILEEISTVNEDGTVKILMAASSVYNSENRIISTSDSITGNNAVFEYEYLNN